MNAGFLNHQHQHQKTGSKIHEETVFGTFPKTNIAPKNGWLQDEIPFWGPAYFQGRTVSFIAGLMTFLESLVTCIFETFLSGKKTNMSEYVAVVVVVVVVVVVDVGWSGGTSG